MAPNDQTPQTPTAQARANNPYANLSLHNGKPRRMGEPTPAKSDRVTSKCTSLRITPDKRGISCYRLSSNQSWLWLPRELNTLIAPLIAADLRPEDDMKIDWSVTWFVDKRGQRVVTRIANTFTGEILAQTDEQPKLVDIAVDETTGQLAEKPQLDPFGKLVDPVKVAMRQLVWQATGNENDYVADYDTYYTSAEADERTKYDMTMTDIAQKARDKQANAELQQTLAEAASADITPDPTTAPTLSELDAHFGPKAKAPGEVTTLTDDEMKESLRMKYREGLGRDMTVADFERATEWKRLEDARDADKGALTDAEIMRMVEADIAAQKKIAQEASKTVEIEVEATSLPKATNEQVAPASVSVEKSKPVKTVALVPTGDSKWDVMTQKAQVMIRSGFMPEAIKTADQVLTIAMMGEALDIDPIVAVNNINVIKGKPTVSPQLMLALVRRSKQLEDFSVVDDGNTCTVTMKRKGETVHIEKFSMEDAQRMKTTEWDNNTKKTISLSEKHNWRQQPAVMRKWRAISAACRVVFPDIIWGLYTTEEIDPDVIVVEAA